MLNPVFSTKLVSLAMSCALVANPVLSYAHDGLDHDIERVSAVVAERPEDFEGWLDRGRYFRLDSQLERSLADLDHARELAPQSLLVSLQRGLTLSALERDVEAEAEFDRVIAGGANSSAAYTERARIRVRSDRLILALVDLDAAIALTPELSLYLERGRLHASAGQLAEEAAGYREGLDRVGDSLLLRRALVRVEIARGRNDEALRLIDEQIAKGPTQVEWRLQRGEVLEDMDRPAEAKQARVDALAQANLALGRRATASNLVGRAKVHLALGDMASARRDLEQALRSSPEMKAAKAMLATLEDPREGK